MTPVRAMARNVATALLLALAACGGDGDPAEPPVASSLQVTPGTVTVAIGQTHQFSASVLDQYGRAMTGVPITWSSSDSLVIGVSATGLASARRAGTATISARAGSLSGSATASVPAPELRVEDGTAVTARIGPAGGSITAVASNGVTYRLTVPRLALRDTVSITLTPVVSLGSVTVQSGVRLRPSGLRFVRPAVLTAQLPAAPADPAGLIGVHFADDLSAISRYPVSISGRDLRFIVSHFSGYATAAGATLANLLAQPSTSSGRAAAAISAALPAGDVSAIIAAFRTWYNASVKPGLSTANADPALFAALGEWQLWLGLMAEPALASFSSQIIAALDPELTEARNLAATALQASIIRHNAACVAQSSLIEANEVLLLQELAEAYAIATAQFGLDRATVLQQICVKVVYAQVTLPDTMRPGRAGTLRVQTGLSYGGGPLVQPFNLEVETTPANATDNSTQMSVPDGIGTITRQITPADTIALQVSIRTCLGSTPVLVLGNVRLRDICAVAQISRTPTNVLYASSFAAQPGGEWSNRATATSPSGENFLGELSSGSVSLTLGALPVHTQLVLELDLYIIDSWNGNGGTGSTPSPPDIMSFVVAGTPILRTTFSNKPRDPQAFPGAFPGGSFPAGTGAAATNALGYPPGSDFFGDSVYRLRLVFAHTGPDITIQFGAQQSSGQNERWGIDNVRLSLGN